MPMLDRRFYWSIVMLRIGLYAFLHFSMGLAGSGLLGKQGGDTTSYFLPIDNLFEHGHYTYLLHYLPAYAGRMPGYGAVYGLVYLLLPKEWIYTTIILLQMTLACIALYYLGRLTLVITRRKLVAYIAMLGWAISPFAAQADMYLLTESFAASALVLALWFLVKGLSSGSLSAILIAGMWTAWLVFLRPMLSLVPLIWVMTIFWHTTHYASSQNRQILLQLLLLVLPLATIEIAWTSRNYLVYSRLIPLQFDNWAGNKVPASYRAAMYYAAAVGDEPVPWNMNSIMGWMISTHAPADNLLLKDTWRLVPPASADSLIWARQQFRLIHLEKTDSSSRDAQLAAALTRWEVASQHKRPLLYYCVAPARLLYYLTSAHGASGLFAWPYEEMSQWQRLLRWFFALLHLGIVSCSLWGLATWSSSSLSLKLARFPLAFVLILLVLVFRQVESRYFAPVYPLAILVASGWLSTKFRSPDLALNKRN